jgi:hypothetical protein
LITRQPVRRKPAIWTFLRSLMAILLGNLIYFSIQPYLPQAARHQLYKIDLGLLIDFVICVGCYALIRLIR